MDTKNQDWQRPTITLLEDGAERTYALKLRKNHCAQLAGVHKAGFPNGMFKGFSEGQLGLEFCADVIALATRSERGGKRLPPSVILESMHREPDEYLIPAMTAIALAANMPKVAREINGIEDKASDTGAEPSGEHGEGGDPGNE